MDLRPSPCRFPVDVSFCLWRYILQGLGTVRKLGHDPVSIFLSNDQIVLLNHFSEGISPGGFAVSQSMRMSV